VATSSKFTLINPYRNYQKENTHFLDPLRSPFKKGYPPGDGYISHRKGKGKSSSNMPFLGDMLVPWRVVLKTVTLLKGLANVTSQVGQRGSSSVT